MIGFSVPVRIYGNEAEGEESGNPEWTTALVSLDTDAAEGPSGKPELDIRLVGDDGLIIDVDVEDAFRAIFEVKQQFNDWMREHRPAEEPEEVET